MTAPRATMRIQFHAGFTFTDMLPHLDHLRALGISHLYASPILKARAGSMHGYDMVDPTQVNPELGGEAALRALSEALRARGMGLIVDIVPNHMAVGGHENRWWLDVLANGPKSAFAEVFDIDWASPVPGLRSKVLVPFLGRPYGEALAAGEIRSTGGEAGSPVALRHFDHLFPLRPKDAEAVRREGLAAYDPATPDGRGRLHALLERQHYRLAWWRAANDMINWRRFFDVSELAGLRVEDADVFEATHETLLRLYGEGVVDGFRVDHVDGLADPEAYCRRLRRRLAGLDPQRPPQAGTGPAYLVVEKILAPGEQLPRGWGTDGTSGYDFMNEVSLLLHAPSGEAALDALWREISGDGRDFAAIEREARGELLERNFGASFEALGRAVALLLQADPAHRDHGMTSLRRALRGVLVCFRRYRTYEAGETGALDDAIAQATADAHPADRGLIRLVGEILRDRDAPARRRRRAALRKFRQLSVSLAAKAGEDTAFYRYGRLLSRIDVGFDPGRLAAGDAFHEAAKRRLASYPAALLATATHDHKRGEDLRARLAVLSEAPALWAGIVRSALAGTEAVADGVSRADRATLFQMIVGGWPLGEGPLSEADRRGFADRLKAWQVKALREAKQRSSWESPDTDYETAAAACIDRILDGASPAGAALAAAAQRIAPAGAVNGLAQCLLKLTAPGVPDIYQGCDLWDFSFVDPDNRRPVDWARRKACFAPGEPPARHLGAWRDGRVKQALIAAALAARASSPDVFAAGRYDPLAAGGARQRHVLAFARSFRGRTAVTVVPRAVFAMLPDGGGLSFAAGAWDGTTVATGGPATGILRNVCDGRRLTGPSLDLGELFREFPVALLVNW